MSIALKSQQDMMLKHFKCADQSEAYCEFPMLVTNGNDSPMMTAWDLSKGEILPVKTIAERNFEIDNMATFGSLLASIEYDPSKKQEAYEVQREAFNVHIYDLSKLENGTSSIFHYSTVGENEDIKNPESSNPADSITFVQFHSCLPILTFVGECRKGKEGAIWIVH